MTDAEILLLYYGDAILKYKALKVTDQHEILGCEIATPVKHGKYLLWNIVILQLYTQ